MSVNGKGGELSLALQYGKYRAGTTEPVKATGKVTLAAQPNNADAVTVGSSVFAFKTVIAAAGDVLIGTNVRESLENLFAAMTGGTGSGTAYFAGTIPVITADVGLSALANVIYLKAYQYGTTGNSVVLTTTGSPRITVSGSGTLAGGLKGGDAIAAVGRIGFEGNVADSDEITIGSVTYRFKDTMALAEDVKRGTDLATSLDNLIATIMGTGTAGSHFYTGSTSPSVEVKASRNNNVLKIEALTAGTAGNSLGLVATTDTGSVMNLTGATLVGGRNQSLYSKSSLSWKGFAATGIDYGAQQMQSVFPDEIRGALVPLGAYKGAVFAQGGMTFLPRFEDSLGELLLATMGTSSTVDNTTYGVHTFKFDPANNANVPWVAIRKKVPGRDAVPGQGMLAFDNLVAGLTLTLNQATPVEARVDFMGRRPELDMHPEDWPAAAAEDFKSVGITCRASFKLPTIFDNAIPSTRVIFQLANDMTGPREELVIGDYYMDDILILRRQIALRFIFKWNTPEMYQRAFGGVDQMLWSPEPFVTETDGSKYAFDLNMEAPFNIPGTSVPYGLRVRANKAFWQPVNDVVLAPGSLVMQEWMCTVLDDPSYYAELILTNGRTTAYTVPSEP